MHNHLAPNDIAQWALAILDLPIHSAIETVIEAPWSRVLKITAEQNIWYLKQTPRELFAEAKILNICRYSGGITHIPKVLAINEDLCCFIMPKCGDVSLRTLYDGKVDAALVAQSMKIYRDFQTATLPHVGKFLDLGLPDWRLEKLPVLYQAVVEDTSTLLNEGLDAEQINLLQKLLPLYKGLCERLADYGLFQSLNHGDLHDNNLLYDHQTKEITLIDMSEMPVSHPFFSLASFLTRTAGRYGLGTDTSEYREMYNACFENWFANPDDLKYALDITLKLMPFYAVLSHMRLAKAAGIHELNKIPRMQYRIRNHFLELISSLA